MKSFGRVNQHQRFGVSSEMWKANNDDDGEMVNNAMFESFDQCHTLIYGPSRDLHPSTCVLRECFYKYIHMCLHRMTWVWREPMRWNMLWFRKMLFDRLLDQGNSISSIHCASTASTIVDHDNGNIIFNARCAFGSVGNKFMTTASINGIHVDRMRALSNHSVRATTSIMEWKMFGLT